MIYPSGHHNSVLQIRSSRLLAMFLSVALAVVTTSIVPTIASAHDNPAPLPTVLIFPFTNGSTVTSDAAGLPLTSDISGNVRLDINALGYYHSTGFSVLNPSIERALNVEGTISFADLDAPTASPDREAKLAQIIGTRYFLDGKIDSITTDPATGTVSVQLEGNFYNANTGAVLKSGNVTGTAAPASKDYDSDQLQSSAIASASGQLVAALIGDTFAHHSSQGNLLPKSHASSDYGKGLLFLFAIALALVIINNHGSHGGASSSNAGSSSGGGTTGVSGTSSTTGPPAPP